MREGIFVSNTKDERSRNGKKRQNEAWLSRKRKKIKSAKEGIRRR